MLEFREQARGVRNAWLRSRRGRCGSLGLCGKCERGCGAWRETFDGRIAVGARDGEWYRHAGREVGEVALLFKRVAGQRDAAADFITMHGGPVGADAGHPEPPERGGERFTVVTFLGNGVDDFVARGA